MACPPASAPARGRPAARRRTRCSRTCATPNSLRRNVSCVRRRGRATLRRRPRAVQNSSGVSDSRVPCAGGRDVGMPRMSSLVQMPSRSGCPQAVRGAFQFGSLALAAVVSAGWPAAPRAPWSARAAKPPPSRPPPPRPALGGRRERRVAAAPAGAWAPTSADRRADDQSGDRERRQACRITALSDSPITCSMDDSYQPARVLLVTRRQPRHRRGHGPARGRARLRTCA